MRKKPFENIKEIGEQEHCMQVPTLGCGVLDRGLKVQVEQDVFVKHECPRNCHFFEKCNLYI